MSLGPCLPKPVCVASDPRPGRASGLPPHHRNGAGGTGMWRAGAWRASSALNGALEKEGAPGKPLGVLPSPSGLGPARLPLKASGSSGSPSPVPSLACCPQSLSPDSGDTGRAQAGPGDAGLMKESFNHWGPRRRGYWEGEETPGPGGVAVVPARLALPAPQLVAMAAEGSGSQPHLSHCSRSPSPCRWSHRSCPKTCSTGSPTTRPAAGCSGRRAGSATWSRTSDRPCLPGGRPHRMGWWPRLSQLS